MKKRIKGKVETILENSHRNIKNQSKLLRIKISGINQKSFYINTFIPVINSRIKLRYCVRFQYFPHYRVPFHVKKLEAQQW